jgi:hypothetical protein
MQHSISLRHVVVMLTAIVMFTGMSGSACSSTTPTTKTCTADEVKACDTQLTQCTTAAPCDDPTNPGYQGCVDGCKKKDCDCQSACGNTAACN